MVKIVIVLTSCLILSGCASIGLTKQEIQTVVLNRCPVLINYTPEQQKMAAEELRKLYSESVLATFITDYSKFREACRVVNKRVKARTQKAR